MVEFRFYKGRDGERRGVGKGRGRERRRQREREIRRRYQIASSVRWRGKLYFHHERGKPRHGGSAKIRIRIGRGREREGGVTLIPCGPQGGGE